MADHMRDEPESGIHSQVVDSIRQQIITGVYLPGERLPSSRALQGLFGTTRATIGRAIHSLVEDGYLLSRERRGVYVADTLPHLTRVAVPFFTNPGESEAWTRSLDVIYREAKRGIPGVPCQFEVYLDVGLSRETPDSQRLIDDVRHHRLAGIFFPNHPWLAYGSPFVESPGLPKVAMMSTADRPDFHTLSMQPSLGLAIEHCSQQGCKRIAFIYSSRQSINRALHEELRTLSAANGLTIPPSGCQYADLAYPESARALVHLLFARDEQRPDALFIADDNFVDPVELGLLDLGIQVPRDLTVVANCNFPQPGPNRLPITRIGYDLRQMLSDAYQAIIRQRQGDTRMQILPLPPITESAFHARWQGLNPAQA